MDRGIRVAAYARVSTEKEDQANSLESQKRYFAEYIRAHEGWILTQVFFDEGISGTQAQKRAGFQAMIEAALRHEMELILTKEVCRFARNTVDALAYTRKLREARVGVLFTIDNIDTREPDGELRLTIMACIAQEESRKISERVKWGQQRRMEQGVVFGRELLGYSVRGGVLSVNEQEAEIVRRIFHKYTNEGKGAYVIARELTEEGIHPKRGLRWSGAVIRKILQNEKYVGDLCQKKTITPDFLTHAKKYNRGEEEMICLSDHHPPIIDRRLWERTQRELAGRSAARRQHSRYSGRHWCSGRIFCAECGGRFVRRSRRLKSGAGYTAWRCCEAVSHGRAKIDADGRRIGCDSGSVNERVLLACISHCLGQVRTDKERLKGEILSELEKSVLPRSDPSGYFAQWRAVLDEILDFWPDCACLFGEVLEKIVIHRGGTAEIRLRNLPVGFRLQYRSCGKENGFRTEIWDTVLLRKDA